MGNLHEVLVEWGIVRNARGRERVDRLKGRILANAKIAEELQ